MGNMKNDQESNSDQIEILIVEDCPTQARSLRHILEREKFKVTWARHGKEALEMLKFYHPALVISDIMMPVMDGFELCRRIKAKARWKDIPIVLLTSLSSREDVLHGLQCGAENLITKPYNDNLLLTRIEYILLNKDIKKANQTPQGFEIVFGGQKHFINADPGQLLSLLISTFESAVAKNQELEASNQQLAMAMDLLEKQTAELEALSFQDGLTGLYNRRGFLTLAEHQIKLASRTQTPLFLLFADLDDLKSINDTYGHAMGDQALVAAARILQTTCRQSDLVARLGGDEFAVLHFCSTKDCTDAILGRLQAHLREYNATSQDHPFKLSLSTGFAWYDPRYPLSLEELLREADEMMYARKKEKKLKLISLAPSTSIHAGSRENSETARILEPIFVQGPE
jgi:diguanylate cyclase (GGDEF)-like protein